MMKKILLTLLVFVGFASSTIAQEETAFSSAEDGQSLFFQNDSLRKASMVATLANADSAFIKGDYITAANMYEEILATQGYSTELYMNLGNSYFKLDETAKAILNYERAYVLDPSNDDVRFNLELARTKVVDKETVVNELFITTWLKQLSTCFNLNQWGIITIILFALASLFAGFFAFCKKIALRKASFVLSVLLLAMTVLSYCFASKQKKDINSREAAIIMSPSVTVKSTPNENGTDLFIIHEGRKVRILDDGMKEWVEIRLNDGNEGWVPVNTLEII